MDLVTNGFEIVDKKDKSIIYRFEKNTNSSLQLHNPIDVYRVDGGMMSITSKVIKFDYPRLTLFLNMENYGWDGCELPFELIPCVNKSDYKPEVKETFSGFGLF